MTGKAGKSGRKKTAPEKRTYPLRLDPVEAAAFDTYVERRHAEASKAGGSANASSVLRGLVRAALVADGLLKGAKA
jgi:hypothetical protein